MKFSRHSSRFRSNLFRFNLVTLLAFLTVIAPLKAATLPPGFTESQYGSDLNGNPTAMEFAPDGRLFVCQQDGNLRVISSNGTLLATPFVTVPTSQNGERGLLGVTFDPNFASNQFVYVYYTVISAPIHNRVARYTANGNVAIGGETVILDLDNLSGATNHNGGAIHFGSDGKLYVAVGENANSANSQSLSNRLGKMLRLNADGTIPADNPTSFPGIAGSPSGANRAIWAVGFRNPFTFGFQPGTGRLFVDDVGESSWEEINDGIVGSNYGWGICEGSCSPQDPNFRDPLFQYDHGIGCAIVGGAFYNPPVLQFPTSYIGKYFFDDLCGGFIRLFDPSNGTDTAFASNISTPVDLKVGPDGSLYYLAQGDGRVWKVRSTSPTPTPAPQPSPFSISGAISYCTNPVPGPVPNAILNLTGSASGSTLSDGSGNYLLSAVPSGGSYTVTPSKPSRTPGSNGISTTDVLAVQRHFLNITLLSGCPLAAADVNADTSITTIDVIAIQRFFLGMSAGTANTGIYQFTPSSRSYLGLNVSQSGQNYSTLVFGDVAVPFVE